MFSVSDPVMSSDGMMGDPVVATLKVLDNADDYINRPVAQDMVEYAKNNIETGSFPSSFDSSGRNVMYMPLAEKTLRDKLAMGAPYMKPNKRWGTLINSIHVVSVSNGEITIIADATHGRERAKAMSALAGRVGATKYDLLKLSRFVPGTGMRHISRGWDITFGPKRRFTASDEASQLRKMRSATKRPGLAKIEREFYAKEDTLSIAREQRAVCSGRGYQRSYAGAVDATRPFLRWTKAFIAGRVQYHLNQALGQFGGDTARYAETIGVEVK
ncbi:MAG: hypothetical protein JRI80_00105 [Deltaproteobacteria bacterium]|nr:hypothetical protein [Deltaproteobacteria bacterium]